jgi:hypothetical protein
VSSLWTPSGEHGAGQPRADELAESADPGAIAPEAVQEELERVRRELAATPVADIVANHAVGLWQLAVLHLAPEEGSEPRLEQASLAIDALGALVENLGDRLGRHADALRDALAQLRVAYVQVRDRGDAPGSELGD